MITSKTKLLIERIRDGKDFRILWTRNTYKNILHIQVKVGLCKTRIHLFKNFIIIKLH